MLSINYRFFLFIFGCIVSRVLFTVLAKYICVKYLSYLGYLALLPAFGFLYIYITGSRLTGFEAGGKIWWNCLRPLHSLLYFLFAYNAILKQKKVAWKFLALDVIIGFFAFLGHHFK